MHFISEETAMGIAFAHRDIRAAKDLLEKVSDAKRWNKELDIRDAFGRQRGLQLGIPQGDNGHRLFEVSPDLAKYVIEAHVGKMLARLAELSAIARMELDGVAAAAESPANG